MSLRTSRPGFVCCTFPCLSCSTRTWSSCLSRRTPPSLGSASTWVTFRPFNKSQLANLQYCCVLFFEFKGSTIMKWAIYQVKRKLDTRLLSSTQHWLFKSFYFNLKQHGYLSVPMWSVTRFAQFPSCGWPGLQRWPDIHHFHRQQKSQQHYWQRPRWVKNRRYCTEHMLSDLFLFTYCLLTSSLRPSAPRLHTNIYVTQKFIH